MSARQHPRAVGAFVLGAIALVLMLIVALSAGDWLVPRDRFVVFFPGSVRGLNPGAAITFRGVKMGEVKEVKALLTAKAGNPIQIEVVFELRRDVLEPQPGVASTVQGLRGAELARELIALGIRGRLLSESLLTGQKYIEFDFLPAEQARTSGLTRRYPEYMANAVEASTIKDAPILIDKFLDNATEVDVDCVADYDREDATSGQAVICGVMEHIEEAGIHSGDSAGSLPPYSLSKAIVKRLKEQTLALAKALRMRGLMNVQYAIKGSEIYVIEVNPRASRTIPFVSKATGIAWAKIAAKVMAGKTLAELGVKEIPDPKHTSVKEVVFPFSKFPGVDVILGPEMHSTGEVMGIDADFNIAFAKSQIAAGDALPTSGNVFISVRDADKKAIVPVAQILIDAGFEIYATAGTYKALSREGIEATLVSKLAEGRPNIIDFIKNGRVKLIINTPTRKGPKTDEGRIRAMAVLHRVPIVTTMTAAQASARAIVEVQKRGWDVRPLQEYHRSKSS